MINLGEKLANAVTKLEESGHIDEVVNVCVSEAVGSAIKKLFRWGGDLREAIDEAVKQSFAIHETPICLPVYNERILELIRQQVDGFAKDSIQQQVAERMNELLEPAPESIELSKLVEAYREQQHGEGDILARYTRKDSWFAKLELGKDCGERAEIEIGLSFGGRNEVDNPSTTIYHMWLKGGNDVLDYGGQYDKLERMLFQCRAAKTRIIIDQEDGFETEYGDECD